MTEVTALVRLSDCTAGDISARFPLVLSQNHTKSYLSQLFDLKGKIIGRT